MPVRTRARDRATRRSPRFDDPPTPPWRGRYGPPSDPFKMRASASRRPRQGMMNIAQKGVSMIQAVIFGILFFLIATFPATWLLMLFLGNVGLAQSYWGTLPLGILVSVLLAGATTPGVAVVDR